MIALLSYDNFRRLPLQWRREVGLGLSGDKKKKVLTNLVKVTELQSILTARLMEMSSLGFIWIHYKGLDKLISQSASKRAQKLAKY